MSDMSLGFIVSGVVSVVVLIVGGVTAMYCKWVERTENATLNGPRDLFESG